MGNRNSASALSEKQRRQSEECKTDSIKTKNDFVKSQSMGELGRNSQKHRKKNSITELRRSANGSKSSVSRQRSIRRDISHPISAQGREIVVQCFENPHSEFGNKVCQRIFEKRPDFQNYVFALGKEKAYNITVRLKELVEEVVNRIDDVDHMAHICRMYGEEHVELKSFGFKPDFWVALADAITVEGVILDMANHQPADTVSAWSQLVTMMFSAVRDGYYSALRAHRMSSRRGVRRQGTADSNSVITDNLNSPTNSRLPTAAVRSVSMYSINGTDSTLGQGLTVKPMPIIE